MAATIASVLSFIPVNIWSFLKKFVKKDGVLIIDESFKWSTKYSPALFVVIMCLSFANQFFRNIEIDCTTSDSVGGVWGRPAADLELNTYCWNYETFLVEKALSSEMRGQVTYPGVSGYDKGHDDLIPQRYYKYVWFGTGIMGVIMFSPLFIWKLYGKTKMKNLVEIPAPPLPAKVEEIRVSYFVATIGFNRGFAVHYWVSKFLATLTPAGAFVFFCGFLGGRYKYYGWDVIRTFLDDKDTWPNPMDALFPKIAKCEWSKYGISGDREIKSAQCQLPMNNLTQWSFFVLWWWLGFVFLVNVLSCLRFLLLSFPPYRNRQVRNFIAIICREEIAEVLRNSNTTNGSRNYQSLVKINLGFSDYLVFSFMRKNLKEWEFRDFVRKLVTTENRESVKIVPPKFKEPRRQEFWGNIKITRNSSPSTQNNVQVGFRESMIGGVPSANPKCEGPAAGFIIPSSVIEVPDQ